MGARRGYRRDIWHVKVAASHQPITQAVHRREGGCCWSVRGCCLPWRVRCQRTAHVPVLKLFCVCTQASWSLFFLHACATRPDQNPFPTFGPVAPHKNTWALPHHEYRPSSVSHAPHCTLNNVFNLHHNFCILPWPHMRILLHCHHG